MQISASSLKDLFSGYNVIFNKGFANAPTFWDKVAMKVTSTGSEENYSWLTSMPGLREWLGDRVIQSLGAARYVIQNKEFESTIEIPRKNIEDDQYGTFSKTAEMMGYETARHPDSLIFGLMAKGNSTVCFDGQYFFDTDHPSYDENGGDTIASNFTDGAGPAWYMCDGSQPVRAMVYQERKPFTFVALTDPTDANVFFQNKYIYGVDGRCNAGFGLWQMAYCSKATLSVANFTAARNSMTTQRKRSGKPLGVMPTTLVVPPSLESLARQILNAEMINGGESNIWAKSMELVVTPFLT